MKLHPRPQPQPRPRTSGRGPLLILVLGVLLGAVVTFLCLQFANGAFSRTGVTDMDLKVLKEEMLENNELSTAKYLYTDSVTVTDQNNLGAIGLSNINLPFTKATYVFEYDGTIKAGYDLSKADVSIENDNTIVVSLPPEQIVSHETGAARLVWEQQNIANPLHAGEESSWIASQRIEMEDRAKKNGLYEEARQNAKNTFQALFETVLPEGSQLDVRFSEEG